MIAALRLSILALAGMVASPLTTRSPAQESAPAATRPTPPPGLEERWLEYKQSSGTKEAKAEQIRRLAQQGDHELLEWIAIYDGAPGALQALTAAKSPRWIRCTVWLANHPDSHTHDAALKNIPKERQTQVLSWLRLHPETVWGAVRNLVNALEKSSLPAQGPGDALPPLDPATVLAHLDAPKELATWVPGSRVADGKVYVHQVLRAMDALVASGLRDEPWGTKLLALTRHRTDVVRRAAHLTFTRFPPRMIPVTEFLKTVQGPGAEEDRRAALMAASFSDHPRVFTLLHAIAADRRHPCWRTAVDRLGDLGDGFTVLHLEASRQALGEEDQKVLDQRLAAIRERVAADDVERFASGVGTLIERAAWTELEGDPLGKTLLPWTRESVLSWARHGPVQRALAGVRDGYVPPPSVDERQANALKERVRSLAGELRK